MLVLTLADRALTAVEVAAVARDRAARSWAMTGPTRRAAKVYARALWAGTRAATPTALAAIATLAVLALALGLLAYRRGRAFRSWCDELVSAAENPPAPAAIAIPPAPAPEPELAPVCPIVTVAPMAPHASAATLRKVCAASGMKGAARATKAQCLEFLAQLAQSPENPAPASVATAGG